jgi:hypothetical protein
MPITTVDVVTNIVNGRENQKTGTVVVCCQATGAFNTIDPTYEKSMTYNSLESKYSNRFDDVTYYTVGSSTIVGG